MLNLLNIFIIIAAVVFFMFAAGCWLVWLGDIERDKTGTIFSFGVTIIFVICCLCCSITHHMIDIRKACSNVVAYEQYIKQDEFDKKVNTEIEALYMESIAILKYFEDICIYKKFVESEKNKFGIE